MNRFTLTLITAVTTVAFATGCEAERNGKMFPDGKYRLAEQHADAQAANGAREDGTLYPRHFAGEKLSSLGQTKLALIARASVASTDSVNVFLDMPEAAATDLRKESVKQFLSERGVIDERIILAIGPNAGTKNLASLTSSKLYKPNETRMDGSTDAATYGAESTGKK